MKKIFFLSFFSCMLLIALPVLAQADAPPDDGFDIFLLLFATVVICLLIGAAIVLTALTLVTLVAVVGFGITFASLVAGIYKRSVQTGFKMFLMLGGGVVGLVVGAVGLYMMKKFLDLDLSSRDAAFYGGLAGLVGGVIAGWVSFFIAKWLAMYIRAKVSR